MSSHYETLGVPRSAEHKEIKTAFRKLSLETHPDVAQGAANAERFKLISEAHRVLSNSKERRLYDLQLDENKRWGHMRNHGGGPHPHGAASPHARRAATETAAGFHGFMQGFYQPRNIIMGVSMGVFTIMALKMALGDDDKPSLRPRHHGNALVEAWKNPESGKWEQPAPWDPAYRKLSPTLHMVPREQVQQRAFR